MSQVGRWGASSSWEAPQAPRAPQRPPSAACTAAPACRTTGRRPNPPACLHPPAPLQPGAKQPTAAELSEAEQEALLRAKYGGLLKKKPLLPQDRKHFDSADWQLNKQGVPAERPQLEPKLNPTVPPARRSSQLGDGQ